MALSKNLAIGQPARVATEATRLASEVCEGIRVSRESIRAALREMGAASDISEVSVVLSTSDIVTYICLTVYGKFNKELYYYYYLSH
jgi:hypothetical protein